MWYSAVCVCVVDLRVCVSVCECLYILLFMNMALPDTLQQKATNFSYTRVHYEHMSVCLSVSVSLTPYILLCLSLRLCFYMNMVACKSKEFRAFTALSLSQCLLLCLFCLLCFSLGMWLSPWPVVRTYAVGQNDHKSQE